MILEKSSPVGGRGQIPMLTPGEFCNLYINMGVCPALAAQLHTIYELESISEYCWQLPAISPQ